MRALREKKFLFCVPVLFGVAGCGRTAPSGATSESPSASAAAAPSSAVPATGGSGEAANVRAPACDDPVFNFGDQDRLRWGRAGVLRRQGAKFTIDLGKKVRFDHAKFGSRSSEVVEVVCGPSCSKSEEDGLLAKCESLLERKVEVDGVLEPTWQRDEKAKLPVRISVRDVKEKT